MAKKRKGRRPTGRPRPVPARVATATPEVNEGGPDPLAEVRRTLAEPHPLDLLSLSSSLLAVIDPDRQDPFARPSDEAPPVPELRELVDSFLDVHLPETGALLTVLAELVPDDVPARRIRRELQARDDALPDWLTGLAPLTVGRAVEMGHVLGDGDNIALDVRTGTGAPLGVMVYIDHNLGTVVKDAFVVDEPVDVLLGAFLEAAGDDPDIHVRELTLADARARIDEAIQMSSMVYPPLENDSWPAARPLIEWVLRELPGGGTGYVRPEWSQDERAALTERFVASPFARSSDWQGRELLDSLLWFGCDYGPGDPLRWSPVAVEILLLDWLPRKVAADPDLLARAPALLRSFIRFAHDERGIRAALTDETLAAVDRFESAYLAAIRSPRPEGPVGVLAALGLLGEPADLHSDDGTPLTYGGALLAHLRGVVGGADALDALDTEPLPDEPLDLREVPEDIHERVIEVAGVADACCGELLDTDDRAVEYRTAGRRLLADVAAADPGIFRRRGRADTAAAAIVWITATANDRLSAQAGGLTATALGAWFGVTQPSQRAGTLLKALRVPDAADFAYTTRIGSPRYLVSARRRAILEARERYEAMEE